AADARDPGRPGSRYRRAVGSPGRRPVRFSPGGSLANNPTDTGGAPEQRPRVVAMHVGKPRDLPGVGTRKVECAWWTGIFKDPVTVPTRLGRINLEGDGQADLKVNGGPDKALRSEEHTSELQS